MRIGESVFYRMRPLPLGSPYNIRAKSPVLQGGDDVKNLLRVPPR